MNIKKFKFLINSLMVMNWPILFFSLVMDHQFQNGLIFFTGLITALYYFLHKKNIVFNSYVILPIGMLILILVGVFYSSNTSLGWLIFSRNLGLLFLPALLMMNSFQLTKIRMIEMFKLYEVSIFILIFLSLIFLSINYYQAGCSFDVYSPNSGALVSKFYIGPYLSRPVGLHNIYMAFFIVVFLLYKIMVQRHYGSFKYWISLLILLVYFGCLKSANLTLVFSVIIFLFVLFSLKIKVWLKIALIFLIIISSFFITKSKVPNLNFELDYTKPYYNSSLELRMLTWNVALENIKENPVIGVGTGDLKKVMTEGFENKGFEWGITHRYDPHNQFLSYWLQNGIMQLALVFLLFFFPIIRNTKKKNYFMLSIVLALFSFCLTESVFMTQTGLFGSIFILYVSMISPSEFK